MQACSRDHNESMPCEQGKRQSFGRFIRKVYLKKKNRIKIKVIVGILIQEYESVKRNVKNIFEK